jgi:hypothetical protein
VPNDPAGPGPLGVRGWHAEHQYAVRLASP